MLGWRPIIETDLGQICRIADTFYPPELHEPDEALVSRARRGERYSAVLEHNGLVWGYIVAHPWDLTIPPLGYMGERLTVGPDLLLYVHDLMISPEYRRQGWARQAVVALQHDAMREFRGWMRLVAVKGSKPFWTSCGFQETPPAPSVASYGPEATLMEWIA